jgi:3'(2'),5'-bisphosphate nucleotidase
VQFLNHAPDLLDRLIAAALEAGRAILDARTGKLSVEQKADASPVTIADRAAEEIILRHLAEIAPGIPVIAEESAAAGYLPEVAGEFFLVDPLDGTKEFVKGGADFTVNIGLIRDGRPALGVVYAPATGELFAGETGKGAFASKVTRGVEGGRRKIHIRACAGAVDVVASKSHRTPETDAYIARYEVGRLVAAGSSLKFCTIAEGAADLYPRMGTTMQWDTAAGDAVLRAAGGTVVTLDGKPLPYGPNGEPGSDAWRNPWFIAAGGIEPIPA